MTQQKKCDLALQQWSKGNEDAFETLINLCYHSHLMPIAKNLVAQEKGNMEAADVVNRSYEKLKHMKREFTTLQQFLGCAKAQMKNVIIELVRHENAKRRGDQKTKVFDSDTVMKFLEG